MAVPKPPSKKPVQKPQLPAVVGATTKAAFLKDISDFAERYRYDRLYEAAYQAIKVRQAQTQAKGRQGQKPTINKTAVRLPASALLGKGTSSERSLMQAFGWYWEPLLHDLNFFEEMRDSVSVLDGSVNKLVDFALTGFKIQCEDQDMQQELEAALIDDSNVDFLETIRNAMVDLYSLGNCYKVPIWTTDDKGRKVPKVFKPIRATALRKLRDEDLCIEGFVQLLHRPSEFIMGTPAVPTFWLPNEIIWGSMRTKSWYAYGTPLFGSIPLYTRLKLVMERDLAEMLHQHVPRIDIKFTPDEQMNDQQVADAAAKVAADVAALKATDNFIHTPDTEIEYKGPAGKGLDFANPQKHIENQIFYILPFAPAIMGLDSTANPYDSQERWTISCTIANSLRAAATRMFKSVFKVIEQDWGMEPGSITLGWTELDPQNQQELAMSEEYQVNNAASKRDNGFIDQDEAARQGTAHQKGGGVKSAAAPGKLPPPVDPNKADPDAGDPVAKKVTNKDKGPKPQGKKAPQSDKRPQGKRHAQAMQYWEEQKAAALAQIGESPILSGSV